jgi:hypothetical protein
MFINKNNIKIRIGVVKIGISNWLISRSELFKDLISNFRDHKVNTKSSFSRVKVKHRDYESKIREHDARIREMEGTIDSMLAMEQLDAPAKIKRKKRKARKKKN